MNLLVTFQFLENMKKLTPFKKRYLHWKWQKRYNRAWYISCHKAYNSLVDEFHYSEDIATCSPHFFFRNELQSLKKYK